MPAFRTPVRRTLVAATAAMAVLALAACGGGGSATAAKDNPYGLQQAGTLRVGTLTDAPPNVYLKDGKFTGFDNDLLTAVAGKLGLKVRVRRHRLLRAARPGQERASSTLGSSSITITDARKKTVAFTNGYDFGYFGLDVPAGSDIKGFDQLKGKRVAVVQGTVQDDYATKQTRPGPGAGLQQRPQPAQGRHRRRLGRPGRDRREVRQGQRRQGHRWRPSSQLFADRVRRGQGNTALRDALNTGLDAGDRRRHLDQAAGAVLPGPPVPEDFKPGSGTVARARSKAVTAPN